MTITDARLAISEVAEATGLSTHTLRYYERAGLMLDPVDRASSSHRRTAGCIEGADDNIRPHHMQGGAVGPP